MTPAAAHHTSRPADRIAIRGPEGLISSIPFLLGFHPRRSLVLLCMRGPRRRVGPVLRIDLPTGTSTSTAIASYLVERAAEHATGVALVCYTDEPDGKDRGRPVFPRADLIHECLRAMSDVGVPVLDALLVRDDTVWSYRHQQPTDPGLPLPTPATRDRHIGHLHSASVASGRAVLPDRQAVVDTIAGPGGLAAERAEEALLAAATRFAAVCADLTYREVISAGWEMARSALTELTDAVARQGKLSSAARADLVVAMADTNLRDCVLSWAVEHRDRNSLGVLVEMARWTPDEWCAPVCSTLAVVAYRVGDGALAQAANDRARAAVPEMRLAAMLTEFFNSGATPDELDTVLITWERHPANPNAPMWQPIEDGDLDAAASAETGADRNDGTAQDEWSGR